MKLPKTLQVSGYTLIIEYKNKIIVNGMECYGFYDPSKKKIALLKGMSSIRKKEIFLHEFIHFLEDIYRFKIKEEEVSSLALGLIQLIVNSKIRWKE